MAFDQETRNRLQRFVSSARALLTEELTRQLQHEYGLDPATGAVADLAGFGHLAEAQRQTARLLRETLEHYLAAGPSGGSKEALDRIVREQAFTVLNRLCALRMAEARALLVESVGNGYQSKGFQLYARLAASALGETGDAYRRYLFSVLDELALDLPVLFDRFSPQGRLFPREATLLALLEQINHPEIAPLWAEDETIGWIYQYFNSADERRQMRAASQAPRNSRELAVRNQFFTPRYVVEFLTDNTLGRLWYEMTQGQTALKDLCRYLVRRPHEVFLAEGQPLPADEAPAEGLSREELLRRPAYIPFRPLKDLRDLKLLDPACGSMHFGLYAFDLFEVLYEEAWDLEGALGADRLTRPRGLAPLRESYPSKEALVRDVPRLIVERNLHGIDIDPRAVQIAGLSLWLRAHRSWHGQGIKPQDRRPIRRSNIVCAEPMPGQHAMLADFIGQLEPTLLGQLVQVVFDRMKLAGDAGSLLKIEDEIREAVATAKRQWVTISLTVQRTLFENRTPVVRQKRFDFSGITDAQFFAEAEARVIQALHAYAEQGQNQGQFRRRLFADDAARGFAFIETCQKGFDVVLMNPPFGEASKPAKALIERQYPRTKNDMYAAFVERGLGLLHPGGLLGAITSRTGFFLTSFQKWREEILLREARPTVFADLGAGVLDAAMVETAAYCLVKCHPEALLPTGGPT